MLLKCGILPMRASNSLVLTEKLGRKVLELSKFMSLYSSFNHDSHRPLGKRFDNIQLLKILGLSPDRAAQWGEHQPAD